MLISIVTISFGYNDDLKRTLNYKTFLDVEHIVVVSGLSQEEASKLKSDYGSDRFKFIINQDKGLYNAMNIGMKIAKGHFIYFLNAGDTFVDGEIDNAFLQLNEDVCHAFRTNQIWESDIYVRPSENNLNKLIEFPAHQGFFAPLNTHTPNFDESRYVDADFVWMKECIELFGISVHKNIIANFYLGGVSNFPCFSSVKKRFRGEGAIAGFKEVFKMLLRLALGDSRYYLVLAERSCYEKVN